MNSRGGSFGGAQKTAIGNPRVNAPLPAAIEQQLGLTLQDAHMSVDVLIIDHAELPVQN